MDNTNAERGEVVIISSTESFLAKSLLGKITSNDTDAFLSRGEIKEIEAEMVIVAAGFAGAEESSVESFGLQLDAKGRIGDIECRTADEKVFACGDMRRGASLVVWAIAEGRACARSVDRYLEGYTNL